MASSPQSSAPPTEYRRTVLWLLGCLCCLALGSIVSFPSAQYAPRLATSMHIFPTPSAQDSQLQLLQSKPSPKYGWSRINSTDAGANTSDPDADIGGNDTRVSSDRYARGVIVSLYDGVASMGASLIRELRCLGNNELVQVYHCFPDELSAESQALLTRNDANVEIIDVCAEILNRSGLGDDVDDVFLGDAELAKSFRSYWLKPLALYHTKLREVVLLDADAVLMRDPADLRAMSGYVRTGTTFFYDRVFEMHRFFNSALERVNGTQLLQYLVATFDYAQFGLEGPAPSQQLLDSLAYRQKTAHEQDSSLVLVDKARAGPALAVLKHLITKVRFELPFSWGDKEAFWLAFELAHRPYFFSPFGLSLLDSVPNADLREHPASLCGSMAHFVPTEDPRELPELLYVNGKALLEPFPLGLDKSLTAARSRMFNVNPTHVTPRHARREAAATASFECMDGMGAVPLPGYFYARLLRRRTHFFAAETRYLPGLDACESPEEEEKLWRPQHQRYV